MLEKVTSADTAQLLLDATAADFLQRRLPDDELLGRSVDHLRILRRRTIILPAV